MIRMKLHIKMAEKRITQSELAKLTGIRQPTISAYYNDTWKTISREHIDILCEFFKCNIEDIIEFEHEPSLLDLIENNK